MRLKLFACGVAFVLGCHSGPPPQTLPTAEAAAVEVYGLEVVRCVEIANTEAEARECKRKVDERYEPLRQWLKARAGQ